MKLVRRSVFVGVCIAAFAIAGLALAGSGDASTAEATAVAKTAAVQQAEQIQETCLAGHDDLLLTPAAKGGKPKPTNCCDPSLQPGFCGNPFCFEGATCCSDGVWRCNNADGSPSCAQGKICDPGQGYCGDPCGGRGEACTTGDDCCSGVCNRKGRCR